MTQKFDVVLSEAGLVFLILAFDLAIVLTFIEEENYLLTRELEEDVQLVDRNLEDVRVIVALFCRGELQGEFQPHLGDIIASVPQISLIEHHILELS